MSTHKDIMALVEFVESVCDSDMLESHNLVGPLSRLKAPIGYTRSDPEHPDWIELSKKELDIIGRCANCNHEIDRFSPHEDAKNTDDDPIIICNGCAMSNTIEELAEKDIILEDY